MDRTRFSNDLSGRLSALSPQLQKAGRYVLDHPEEIAMNSLRSVAAEIEVAPPTMSRLARALGFHDYSALRETCRATTRHRHLSLAQKAKALQAAGRGMAESERVPFAFQQSRAALDNIETFLAELDVADLRRAVDRIAKADRVLVIGSLSVAPFARYLAYVAGIAFDNWFCVGDTTASAAAHMAGISKKSAAIALGMTPFAATTLKLTEMARERGACVLAITDDRSGPLAILADHVVLAPSESPQFFPSHISSLLVMEILIGMLMIRAGSSAVSRVQGVEDIRNAIGETWTASPDGQ